MLSIILLLIILIVLLISFIFIYKLYKNSFILCDKDKDFIIFAIDMYIEYGKELNINSEDKHELMIENFKKILKKLDVK